MRRAINTIPNKEYNELIKFAALRMHRKIQRLADEEISKMREADTIKATLRKRKYTTLIHGRYLAWPICIMK